MRILFCFRKAELPEALLGDPFAQRVHNHPRREDRVHKALVRVRIFNHPKHLKLGPRARIKPVKIRLSHCRQYLPRAVGTEIEAENAVTVLHTLIAAQNRGRDKLVGLAAVISI